MRSAPSSPLAAACPADATPCKFAVILGGGDGGRATDERMPALRVAGVVRTTRNDVVHAVRREHVAPAAQRVVRMDELWHAGAHPEDTLEALGRAYAGMPVLQIAFVHERTIFERPASGATVRRLSFLQRHADLSRPEFCAYWHDVHAPMAACHRHVARYAQNHVVADRPVRAAFDGVAEFDITDPARLQEDYATDAGRAMRDDVHRFAATVSTYVVRARPGDAG